MSSPQAHNETTPLLAEQASNHETEEQEEQVVLEGLEDPKQWPGPRKWFCAIMVSSYALMSPTSSAMVVPILPQIRQDLNIESETLAQAVLAIFVFSWCLGPLFIGPCSELFGRITILNAGHLLFILCTILCGLQTNQWTFLLLRLVSGFAGSAPLALGGGLISDLWSADERGKSLAIYTLAPLLGPAVGPILGAWVGRCLTWRWVFFIVALISTLCLSIGYTFIPETFAPILIKRKQQNLQENTGAADKSHQDRSKIIQRFLRQDLPRPFIMLFTQPIIQAVSLYFAYLWGLNNLTIASFLKLFTNSYQQPPHLAALNYISIATGFVLGSQLAPVNDMVYRRLKAANSGIGLPEFRAYIMIPASFLVPVGLLLYGWSAERHWHWILPNLGIFTYSFGLLICYQAMNAYMLDCYPSYAASALGALTVTRCISGFVFPMLSPSLYAALGYGWSSSLLAGISLLLGGMSPWILKAKGPHWREMSTYAAGEVKIRL